MYFIAFFYDIKRKLGRRIGMFEFADDDRLFVEDVFDDDSNGKAVDAQNNPAS